MLFKDILIKYMERLSCNTKELSEASGLSASVISRYRSGERMPGAGSEQLSKLVFGIVKLANSKGISDIIPDTVSNELDSAINQESIETKNFSANFNYMVSELHINVSAMAKALSYDASFLSRIRTGERMPSNISAFAHKFSHYIIRNYNTVDIAKLIGKYSEGGKDSEYNKDSLSSDVLNFLLSSFISHPDRTSDFLHKLDDFDLNQYIRSIHFDELKVPSVPFTFHSTKTYYGVDGQKKGELDFLKGSVLSKSNEPVFMCTDMDMSDMAEDLNFSKNWMLGLAMLLKKDVKINMVHNLNRPFGELMLGLEAWIPLYMTGNVRPYYIKGLHNDFYQHMLYTSGSYALSGECIKGFHSQGKYVLTNNKDEIKYYKERSACILKKAHPLMDIYTADELKAFQTFQNSLTAEEGNRHYLCSSLPAFMLEEDSLRNILQKNQISADEIDILCSKHRSHRIMRDKTLKKNKLLLESCSLSEEEFLSHPAFLDLTGYGYDAPIAYGYEDYKTHIAATLKYADENPNCAVLLHKNFVFRNINIHIIEGKFVWISKTNDPIIHFIIQYPTLREAIENMYIPVYD